MATKSPITFYVARTFKVLKNYTPELADAAFKKRGFYDTRLIHDWPNIIGAQWAPSTFPEKLSISRKNNSDSVLHIRTTSSDAFLLRHIEPQLIERINTYFGRTVVTRLRFIHDSRVMKTIESSQMYVSNEQSIAPSPLIDDKSYDGLSEPLKQALQSLNTALIKPIK